MIGRSDAVSAPSRGASVHVRRLANAWDRTGIRYCAALGLFTLITIAWFYGLLRHLDSAVLMGPNDETYAVREYWGADQAGKTPFTWRHDDLNGAPEGFPFAPAVQIANLVQPGFVWVLRDVLGLFGAFNLFILIGFPLTAFSVFVLCDRLGFSPLGGLFAGYAVAFNPWMIERAYAGHAGYMHAWVFVVLILLLLRAHRRRGLWDAAFVGAALALSFYVSSYYGLLALLVYFVFWLVDFAVARGWDERLWTATLVCASLGAAVALLLPAFVAWSLDSSAVAGTVSNSVEQLQDLGASPQSYVLPSTRHPLLGGVTRSFDVLADRHWAENTLYLGMVTIVLGLVGIVLVLRRHSETLKSAERRFALLFMTVLVPAAFLASLKRELTIAGVAVPMPSYLMGEVTTFWRVYARFGVIVLLALSVLAAFTLHLLARRRYGTPIALVLLGVLVFEFLPGRIPIYRTDRTQPYVEWLAHQPRGIVANYPMPTDTEPALALLASSFYEQMRHGQPLYAAFGSGLGGTREEAIRLLSRYVTDPVTPGVLAAEHVRYVLLHDDVYREEGRETPTLGPSFRHLATLGDVRAYELRAKPADLDRLLEENAVSLAGVEGLAAPRVDVGAGFHQPETTADGRRFRWMTQDGIVHVDTTDTAARRFVFSADAFSASRPRTLTLLDGETVLGTAQIGTAQQHHSIGPFKLPHGDTDLTLRVSPPPHPLGGGDDRVASIYLSEPSLLPAVDLSASLRRDAG